MGGSNSKLEKAPAVSVRIEDSSIPKTTTAMSMTLKGAKYHIPGEDDHGIEGDVTITIKTAGTPVSEAISTVTKSDKWDVGMQHNAVILENSIELVITSDKDGELKSTFSFCTAHVLNRGSGTTRLELYFTRSKDRATKRVDLWAKGTTAKLELKPQPTSSMACMGKVAESFGVLIDPEFRAYKEGITDAALGDIQQTNCVLATIRMIAVLYGRDPDDEVRKEVARNRGKMLRFSVSDLVGLDKPIPCGLEVKVWDTMKTKTGADGTEYRYQKRNAGFLASLKTRFSATPDHVVHTEPYRIIKRGPFEGSLYTVNDKGDLVEEDEWLETSRGVIRKTDDLWEEAA